MIRLGRPAPRAKDHDDKLVPMINVIFLLLMFFLIAGNLKPLFSEEQLIPLSRSEALPARERIELSLSRDGVLTWGGEAVDARRVAARLGARLRAQPDGVPEALSLRADARTQAAALLPVLDALRGIGVQRIAIVTLRR